MLGQTWLVVSMSLYTITYPGTWVFLAATAIFTRLNLSILIELLKESPPELYTEYDLECVSETG